MRLKNGADNLFFAIRGENEEKTSVGLGVLSEEISAFLIDTMMRRWLTEFG